MTEDAKKRYYDDRDIYLEPTWNRDARTMSFRFPDNQVAIYHDGYPDPKWLLRGKDNEYVGWFKRLDDVIEFRKNQRYVLGRIAEENRVKILLEGIRQGTKSAS